MAQRSGTGEHDHPSQPAHEGTGSSGSSVPAQGRGVLDRRSGLDRRLIAEMAAKLARESRESDEAAVELDAQAAGSGGSTPPSRPTRSPDDFDSDDSDGKDGTGLERRRGPGRRRTDYTKAAEEGEMTQEQFLFISAVEAFKRSNNKMFPTWTDVLEVVRLLGYRKTMPSELNLRNVEDWTEKPTTTSGVRSKPGHPESRREAA